MLCKTKQISLTSSALILLVCVLGATLAQTFQYTRGWTNGKKRGVPPVIFQDSADGNEVLGICQMARLREILAEKRPHQIYLPCQGFGKPNEDIERYRVKGTDLENPAFGNTGGQE